MTSYVRLSARTHALLGALKQYDEATAQHWRTGLMCESLGKACTLSQRELVLLRIAGGIHDIGKIGIPDDVLNKPGRYNAEDTRVMETHSAIGSWILRSVHCDGTAEVAKAVHHHHEDFLGSGYPDGFAGEDIPVLSRIIALADSYDALASMRPYHGRRTHQQIMTTPYEENAHRYDPKLLSLFERCEVSVVAARNSGLDTSYQRTSLSLPPARAVRRSNTQRATGRQAMQRTEVSST